MEYNFKCNQCGEIYRVKEYHRKLRNGCLKCGKTDIVIQTSKPLIYHPRLYIDWDDEFKAERYSEIIDYLKHQYVHHCKFDIDSGITECHCKEKDFQNEIVEYMINRYESFLKELPEKPKQDNRFSKRRKEGESQEESRVVIRERALWSPKEAVKWYTRIGTKNWEPGEMEASRYRMIQRIDVDVFNIAIELKVGGNPTYGFRDLLAECLRNRMIAGKYVIGVYLKYPNEKSEVRELYTELFKESGIELIVSNEIQ